MRRPDSSDTLFVLENAHGVGKHGYGEGDPEAARKGTQVTADAMNHITEEIANVVEGFGLALDKTKKNQMYFILEQKLALASGAAGQVAFFAQQTAPSGWLKANGAAISRVAYATLFAAIGTTFGAGDGSTTFNLPDMRGLSARGWDDSRGVDTGRVFGSFQDSQNKAHTHSMQDNGWHQHAASTDAQGDHGHTAWTDAQGHHQHYVNLSPIIESNSNNSNILSARGDGGYGRNLGVNSDGAGNHAHNLGIGVAGSHGHNVTIGGNGQHAHVINSDGGIEVRVKTLALLACIKY